MEWLLQTSEDENRRLLAFFEEFLSDLRQLLANLAGQPVMDAAGLYARESALPRAREWPLPQ